MQRPNPTRGLRHLALYVKNFAECAEFYIDLVGMKVDWQPDADNLYLTLNDDNLALHRAAKDFHPEAPQKLDHLGFFLDTKEDVDSWHDYLKSQQVIIKAAPKDHRDGTRSFYCADPDGNIVQFIYYPKTDSA